MKLDNIMTTEGAIEKENDGTGRRNPNEVPSSAVDDNSGMRGCRGRRESLMLSDLARSQPDNNTSTTIRTTSGESWMQQSLAMPSVTHETTTNLGGNNFAGTTMTTMTPPSLHNTQIAGPGDAIDSPAAAPFGYHSREMSLESFSGANQSNHGDTGTSFQHPYGRQALWGSTSGMNGDDSFYSMGASSTNSFSNFLPATQHDREGEAGTTTGNSTNNVSSDIHCMARITNWKEVAMLCEVKPEGAAYIEEDNGWTALHHACSRRCPYPEVVKALIKAYPDALLITEGRGFLPLHFACRFKAPKDVVKLLLHMYPEKGRVSVSRPDRKGRSPLYYAVRYDAPAGVAGLLIEMDASAVLEEDQNADSPLALVWNDWADKSAGKRTLRNILLGSEEHQNVDFNSSISSIISYDMHNDRITLQDRIENAKVVRRRLERNTKVFERWKKVNIFLKAAFGFPLNEGWEIKDNIHLEEEEKKDTQEERKWRVLHAVSAIKCHYSLFLLAFSLHPEQAFELDRNDLRRIDNIYNKSKDSSELNPSDLTALHLAASSHFSGDTGKKVVAKLLSLNPDAVKRVDTEGSTPLHRISENKFKSDWSFVDDVYASNTDAITEVDLNGRLPLHRAASAIAYFNKNVENNAVMSRSVICRLLREHVDAARSADHFGCLPLHLLAQNGSGWDVQAQALFDANPDAVRVRTGVKFGNRLPLHLAAENVNSDFTMIGKLTEYNPIGASQADRKGLYPMHLACESGLSWKSVQLIHEAFPLAVEQAEGNKRGWNALHMATSSESSDSELLSKLVEVYPQAASIKDTNDRFPLHLACMANKDWEGGLSCLFDTNPNAIRCRDTDGMMPLHIVAFRYCSKPASVGDISPKVTDTRSSRLSMTFEASEKERLATAKEKKEAQELTNIFEMVKADPTVLLV